MIDSKIIVKDSKLKIKQRVKDLINLIGKLDIDFIFVFLASFIAVDYLIWQRLLFSIGLVYIYKLIIKDLKIFKRLK